MVRKTSKDAIDVKFKAPSAFIRQFDEVTRSKGFMTRGEAIRSAMQRYMEAVRGSQTTHTERLDR
jgi:metal-responsive CopG/Arc/MetJ family transcriptional regulator